MDMLFCMRTTLNLDDTLMRAVKRRAADSGLTITRIIEASLRETLARDEAARVRPFRLRLPVVKGRPRQGVDLSDRDALYEIMEGRR